MKKKYFPIIFLTSFFSTHVFAAGWQSISCPTELIPQSTNPQYISNEFPGWKSDLARNAIAPKLSAKHFSHALIRYGEGTTYIIQCFYDVGKSGLYVRMTTNKPVNDIVQNDPKNWKDGMCFKAGEAGLSACSFK